MLQGPGQRFDFHMNKVLCDLRSVPLCLSYGNSKFHFRTKEIFDIIIDYPDSNGALQDLKVFP